MRHLLQFIFVLVPVAGCAGLASTYEVRSGRESTADLEPWDAPPLERAISIHATLTGAQLDLDELLDQLAEADVVFLGETHNDETTHRVELAVYEGLLKRRKGNVVLAMEMFERDAQPSLDDYLAGRIDEATFRSQAHVWQNYQPAYRWLIERAREAGAPVVASNFPRRLRGRAAELDSLEGDERRMAPEELFTNTEAYWRRVDNAVRGHLMMMGGGGQPPEERLLSVQSLWDNSMGESCARALVEHPGALVLHVNGGFHSAYHDGTVHQLRLRAPDAKVLTVGISPSSHPAVVDPGGLPVADFMVYAESRASDQNEGTYSVYVQREVEYRLHMPKTASANKRVPLLIWLSDGGLTAKDGMALWRERLGDDVAIAVLKAPYRETQEDLVEGGRWFWPDSFSGDIYAMLNAVERTWGYLARNFPVDTDRVCLAGEGTGGTVVAAISLLTGRLEHAAVAIAPRRYVKIKDFPLPLPELRGEEEPARKSLRLLVSEKDESWWTDELEEYAGIGFDSELVRRTDDAWHIELESENALRTALGLNTREYAPAAKQDHFIVDADATRARYWARLRAVSQSVAGTPVAVLTEAPADGSSVELQLNIAPDDYREGRMLPRCPGPFGGTTILVLTDSVTAEDAESWHALAKDDPLNARSRFHRMRVTSVGELAGVLSELLENSRRNVLILPAEFCAGATLMRSLRRSTREFDDRMTLHFLPGLGAGL